MVWVCLIRLVFNRCSIDRNWKFSVFKYLTNLFFHASFMFRIHMNCTVFCIHLVVLQSYLLCKYFSLLMQLFMGHVVSCLHLLKERIFFSCVSSTYQLHFLSLVCVSLFSPPPKVFPKTVFSNTCFVFPIFIGGRGKVFF